jgi:hypothetical protein
MTIAVTCDYCGVKGAAVREPGEPPTCYTHRDIPRRERERDDELERLQRDLYEGVGRAARRLNTKPPQES